MDDPSQSQRSQLIRRAREDAYRLLEHRQRSIAEIGGRLARKGFPADIVEEVIAGLEQVGLLDDSDFSRRWVRSRMAQRPMGRRALTWELRQKGVSDDLIDEALREISDEDELEAALHLARRRLKKDAGDPAAEKRRLASLLRRRGFGWEAVSAALEQILSGDSDSD